MAPTQNTNDAVEKLLRENLALTKQIFEHTKKTRRYIFISQILNVFKVVLIAGPIIFAIIYLPPIISQFLETYTELLGAGTGQTILEGGGFVNQLFGNKPQ